MELNLKREFGDGHLRRKDLVLVVGVPRVEGHRVELRRQNLRAVDHFEQGQCY